VSTTERYGNAVWLALTEIFNAPETKDDEWITIGEVAERAGVSRPTAKKYLELLKTAGHAKRVCLGKRRDLIMGYRPQWGAS